jgi:hypothetical protein
MSIALKINMGPNVLVNTFSLCFWVQMGYMSQWDYWKKGLHDLFAKNNFSYE